jgi:hypothetical protein
MRCEYPTTSSRTIAASRLCSRAKLPSPERCSPYRDVDQAPIAKCTTTNARECVQSECSAVEGQPSAASVYGRSRPLGEPRRGGRYGRQRGVAACHLGAAGDGGGSTAADARRCHPLRAKRSRLPASYPSGQRSISHFEILPTDSSARPQWPDRRRINHAVLTDVNASVVSRA